MLLHILDYYYSAAADYSGANPSAAAAVAVALKFEGGLLSMTKRNF